MHCFFAWAHYKNEVRIRNDVPLFRLGSALSAYRTRGRIPAVGGLNATSSTCVRTDAPMAQSHREWKAFKRIRFRKGLQSNPFFSPLKKTLFSFSLSLFFLFRTPCNAFYCLSLVVATRVHMKNEKKISIASVHCQIEGQPFFSSRAGTTMGEKGILSLSLSFSLQLLLLCLCFSTISMYVCVPHVFPFFAAGYRFCFRAVNKNAFYEPDFFRGG